MPGYWNLPVGFRSVPHNPYIPIADVLHADQMRVMEYPIGPKANQLMVLDIDNVFQVVTDHDAGRKEYPALLIDGYIFTDVWIGTRTGYYVLINFSSWRFAEQTPHNIVGIIK